MIGFELRRRGGRKGPDYDNLDVAKVFFDSFSGHLSEVEGVVKLVSSEVEKLKVSRDRSQISDIVLLERIEKIESMLSESLTWIRRVADAAYSQTQKLARTSPFSRPTREAAPVGTTFLEPSRPMVSPSGQAGSLGSITTPTELQVLSLLAERGPLSAPEVGRLVGRSREHSARLMKKLFEEGYVRRDQVRVPFRYTLVDRVRQGFKNTETKPEQEETVAAAQA